MAVTAWVPTKAIANLLGGELAAEAREADWLSDEWKCALAVSTLAPNRDTIESYADLGANEVAAGGAYVAGGIVLTTKTIIEDAVNNRQKFDSDDAVWAASTITARYAVIYDNTPATAADKVIVDVIDFGVDESSSSGEFRVAPPATGWFYADAL